MTESIASLSLSSRVVLLTLTNLSQDGETPAHTGEVIRANADHLDAVEAETLGKVSEAEVSRALNSLEDEGLVEIVDSDDTSPVGKGRPAYSLTVDAGTVLDALTDDTDVAPLADRLAQN